MQEEQQIYIHLFFKVIQQFISTFLQISLDQQTNQHLRLFISSKIIKTEYLIENEKLTDTQQKSASFQAYHNSQLYPQKPTQNVCSFCNKMDVFLYRANCGCNLCANYFCPIHSFRKQTNKQEKTASVVENSESQEQSQAFSEIDNKDKKEKQQHPEQEQEQVDKDNQENEEVFYTIQPVSLFPIDQYKYDWQCYQSTIDNAILCPFNKYVTKQQSNCNVTIQGSNNCLQQQSQHAEQCKFSSNSSKIHASELLFKNIIKAQSRGDLLTIQNKYQYKVDKPIFDTTEQTMPVQAQLITSNYVCQSIQNDYIYQRSDWFNLELVVFQNCLCNLKVENVYVTLNIKTTGKVEKEYRFNVDLKQLVQYKILRFFCQLQCIQEQGIQFTVTNQCDMGDKVLQTVQKSQSFINQLKLHQLQLNYNNCFDVLYWGSKINTVQNALEYLNNLKKKTENKQYAVQLMKAQVASVVNNIVDKFYKIYQVQKVYLEILQNFLETQYKLDEQSRNVFIARCHRIKFFWPELGQKAIDIINWLVNLKHI